MPTAMPRAGPNSANLTGMTHSLRQVQKAFQRSIHGTLADRLPSATTTTKIAAPIASVCAVACRSFGRAYPLEKKQTGRRTVAALASGGDTATVQAPTIAAQHAASIQRAADLVGVEIVDAGATQAGPRQLCLDVPIALVERLCVDDEDRIESERTQTAGRFARRRRAHRSLPR